MPSPEPCSAPRRATSGFTPSFHTRRRCVVVPAVSENDVAKGADAGTGEVDGLLAWRAIAVPTAERHPHGAVGALVALARPAARSASARPWAGGFEVVDGAGHYGRDPQQLARSVILTVAAGSASGDDRVGVLAEAGDEPLQRGQFVISTRVVQSCRCRPSRLFITSVKRSGRCGRRIGPLPGIGPGLPCVAVSAWRRIGRSDGWVSPCAGGCQDRAVRVGIGGCAGRRGWRRRARRCVHVRLRRWLIEPVTLRHVVRGRPCGS